MEEKINKLFALFNDIKNEQLFSLALAQIVSIYNDYPACLYQILRKTNKLVYSRVQDQQLRLAHSQLASGIIEKTYKIYCDRLYNYIQSEQGQNIPENLFHFEPILNKSEDAIQLEKTNSYDAIKTNIKMKLNQIDFAYLIQDEEMILGKDHKYIQRSKENKLKDNDSKNEQEQQLIELALRRLGISANFNEANAARVYQYMQGNVDFIMETVESDDESVQSSSDEDVLGQYEQKKSKNKNKKKTTTQTQTQENTKKQQQQLQQQQVMQLKGTEYCVINPFNILYNRALYELLSHKWQERRSSGLVLRSIVKQRGFEFIDFKYMIKGNEVEINQAISNNLMGFIQDRKEQLNKIEYLLTRCCVIIAMDRFADYVSDQTHMMVREVACQIAITLLSDDMYHERIWKYYPQNIVDFIELMRDFLKVSQSCHIYEVSQSALFLIHGLLKDKLQLIFELFSPKLLQVGQNDNVDEVLILLADIWQQFISLDNKLDYFQQVYNILLTQLHQQDDISYSAKAIFTFLDALFKQNMPIQSNFYLELDQYKKFYFNRIQAVRESFYKFLLQFIKYHINIPKGEDRQQFISKFMVITYQHALFEENAETFDTLAQIFGQFSTLIDKQLLNNVLEQCHLVATKQSYRQLFVLFDGMHNDQLSIVYPIQPLQQQLNQIDNQTYRMIKTAYMFKYIDIQLNIEQFDTTKFIWTFRDYMLCRLNSQDTVVGNVCGQCFDEIDLDIQVTMQELNIMLTNYAKNEKELEYLTIINAFLKLYTEFALSPAHSLELRLLYPSILQQLKQLGTIDYEMDTQSMNKLQQTISRLVDALQLYNRMSGDLLLNFKIILTKIPDAFIARLKVDKFHVLQDIAAQGLIQCLINDSNCCDLTPLYAKIPTPQHQVHYLLTTKGLLKRNDYGRKKLMLLLLSNHSLFTWWHLFFERLFLQQLSFITPKLQPTDQPFNQTINIRCDDLKHNIWGLRMIQNVYSMTTNNPEFDDWIYYILTQLCNLMPVLTNLVDDDQTTIVMKNATQIIQFVFDQNVKKFNPISITNHVNKLYAKLLNLIILTKQHQVIDKSLLLINQMFKNNLINIYEIVSVIIRDYPTVLCQISGFLTLKVIKKLTCDKQPISQAASRLLGLLVPLVTISTSVYQPNDVNLLNKFHKAKVFQEGFGKMTQVQYPIEGGLLNPSIIRDYQWDGIRWLGFLVKYNLHGALCDDMGLGKTLQTLVVIANEVYKRRNDKLICLVVAPSTVVDHWYAECKKYIHPGVLRPHIYQGSIDGNLLLVSYNQMLKAGPLLLEQEYFFLVLDEAHILKNNKNKSSKIIRSIQSKHKVVLSGTPVQNHLLELWSLFDLLLQNYLGDEEYFKKNFSKAFHTNLFSLTDDEMIFDAQQTKTLKLLHKKVLPFIMRRTKQDVLPQLPPKIIEDYYCHLAEPLQSQLYEILDRNSFSGDVEQKLQSSQGDNKVKVCESVFKLLHMLRQVLDHPYLIRHNLSPIKKTKKKVKTNQDSEQTVNAEILKIIDNTTNPEAYTNSGKMIALKDILQQLGFNSIDEAPTQAEQIQIFTNYNKVLIFSRFRSALTMIAEQLLKLQFPGLQYLTLDGSVVQQQRYPLITKFNEDPDIRVLLLTTQVGGLGLNLSSANIVIMFDHDYNPVNDQQAMDRAHRIGQQNVVQVFRLIVKNTLEEKIMGIQRFKCAISKAIVNSDNASLKSMEKTDILTMLEQNAQQSDKEQSEDQVIEKLSGQYQKILSQLNLGLLDSLDFDKEY